MKVDGKKRREKSSHNQLQPKKKNLCGARF